MKHEKCQASKQSEAQQASSNESSYGRSRSGHGIGLPLDFARFEGFDLPALLRATA